MRGDVRVTMSWAGTGMEEWRKLSKWIGKASDQAAAALRSGGWDAESPSVWMQSTVLGGRIEVPRLQREHTKAADALSRAAQFLKFE